MIKVIKNEVVAIKRNVIKQMNEQMWENKFLDKKTVELSDLTSVDLTIKHKDPFTHF